MKTLRPVNPKPFAFGVIPKIAAIPKIAVMAIFCYKSSTARLAPLTDFMKAPSPQYPKTFAFSVIPKSRLSPKFRLWLYHYKSSTAWLASLTDFTKPRAPKTPKPLLLQ